MTHSKSSAGGRRGRWLAPALLHAAAFAFSVAAAGAQAAESYPARPVTLVVPFTAGGITDASARLVARKLGEALNQSVVVENKPGAGGAIGTRQVAMASPDGYTLLLGTIATQVINPLVYKDKIAYDPNRDLTAVHGVMGLSLVIVANPDPALASLADLVDKARAKPGAIAYGSTGVGTASHLSGELLQRVTHTSLVHVPYKGSAPVISGLLGGDLNVAFDYVSSTAPHIRAGKLRALAVTGDKRLPALPDTPTLKELGYGDASVTSWIGIFAPAATPRSVIDALSDAMDSVLRQPDLEQGIADLGGQPLMMKSAALNSYAKSEFERWRPVVEAAGLKPE
ncbi:tripartite tricarboxylate transporter substrate binding protein [Achromobacter spanius]|uniref:Bug family tripartite tricarboxylate transporter substrate binding protein n=1 Tax=Achromobacter spanius TaxID=217203 RepID=UPI003208CCF0